MDLIRLILNVALLFGFSPIGIHAQSIFIREHNGVQNSQKINEIRSLTFSTGKLIVNTTIRSADNYELSEIQYLNFFDLTTAVSMRNQDNLSNSFLIYPNPVHELLNVQFPANEKSSGFIKIFSIEGREVYYEEIKSEFNICRTNVSALPKGIYMCKIGNERNFKTLKLIKQ